ncbi:hypothetical protein [Streptococcus mutans]|uniref:hypothetical protein n=1 Tax=Streptococcus mutans TaxID=1309 RepID=UPI002283B53B|nr:hypothetical protein [Streptococcus mutans]MCY7116767.1 hypothetical protein [Streptococcus mutans]
MAESFDYMTWIKDFERVNGRPPTSQEVEEAQGLVSRYITEQTASDWANQGTNKGLGWFWKTLLVIFSTPIYLIKFFFNLIKATIGVFVLWFVGKFIFLVILVVGLSLANIENPKDVPSIVKWFGELLFGNNVFQDSTLSPDFFPHPTFDGWLIGLTILIFALLFTFSNYDKHS